VDKKLIPYWFYLIGSLCFGIGTCLAMKDIIKEHYSSKEEIERSLTRGWHGHVLTDEDKAANREYLDKVREVK